MNAALVVLGIVAAVAVGAAAWLLWDRSRLAQRSAASEADRANLEKALSERGAELADLRRQHTEAARQAAVLSGRAEEFEKRLDAERQQLKRAHDEHQQAFDALAAKALKGASEQFLKLAGERFDSEQQKARSAIDAQVKPIADTLRRTDEKLADLEKQRLSAYAGLTQQITAVTQLNTELKRETGNLFKALSKPQVRGRYGEIQLERVAELAGMRAYCDFSTQQSARDDDGRLSRPDMVVRLPNERCVAVDAKTNIDAYLEAINAQDPDEAERCLDRFAGHVTEQAVALSKKEYWSNFDASPEFVVMFIPGDQFIDAALQRRPELLELAAQHRVILASPSTLIGLLRAVYVGWREKQIGDQAQDLFKLGRELHERVEKVLRDAVRLGSSLEAAAKAYNEMVGSIDSRLMPTMRRFEDAGAKSDRELPEVKPVDSSLRGMVSLPAAPEPDSHGIDP